MNDELLGSISVIFFIVLITLVIVFVMSLEKS